MRHSLALSLIFVAFFVTHFAFAADSSGGDYSSLCNDPQAQDEATKVACSQAKDTLGEDKDASKNYFETVTTSEDVDTSYKLAIAECEKTQDLAQECCDGDSKGECSSASTTEAAKSLANPKDPDARGGIATKAAEDAKLQSATGQLSARVAGMCLARKQMCGKSCGKMAKDLAAKNVPNCTNCANYIKTLNGDVDTCKSYSASKMLDSAKQNFSAAKQDDGTQKKAGDGSSDPSGKTPGNSADNMTPQSTNKSPTSSNSNSGAGLASALAPLMSALANQQTTPTTPTAATTPQSASCGAGVVGGSCGQAAAPAAAAASAWPHDSSNAKFEPASTDKGSFNPQSTADALAGGTQPSFGATQAGAASTAQTVANGGGQMLGGGGGGGGATLGSSGNNGAFQTQSKVNYTLGDAHGGGGYSQQAAGMNTSAGGTGGWSSYGGRDPASENVDWSQFLPGGKHDPTRKLAGGAAAQNMQIQSAQVNIWSRISDHIRARCSQGLLRDCVP